jgi:soluble lytic murein transglycosylase-like protein
MPRDGIAKNFQCPNGPCFAKRPTIAQLKDPEFNIQFGARMLANLAHRNGSLREALKAYGPMDVGYSYADKVLRIYEEYGG